MKIGDEVIIHGFIDDIRNNTIIIRNDGCCFKIVKSEVYRIERNDISQTELIATE